MAVVSGSKPISRANEHVSRAMYGEPLSVSHSMGWSGGGYGTYTVVIAGLGPYHDIIRSTHQYEYVVPEPSMAWTTPTPT